MNLRNVQEIFDCLEFALNYLKKLKINFKKNRFLLYPQDPVQLFVLTDPDPDPDKNTRIQDISFF